LVAVAELEILLRLLAPFLRLAEVFAIPALEARKLGIGRAGAVVWFA
jgi:hypothetical protein